MKAQYGKITVPLLIILMLTTMLTACTQSNQTDLSETPSSPAATADNSEDAWQQAATTAFAPYPETVAFTVGRTAGNYSALAGSPYEKDNDDNDAVTRFMEHELNLDISNKFVAVDGDDYQQKVSMAIVSRDIPDVMSVGDYATLKELYENNLIEDLTDAYTYCASDNMRAIYDSYDGRALEAATFGGRLMALPSCNISHGFEMLYLRKDWMDKLGLKEPKTLEEVAFILNEFITRDPGENGSGNTIGLVALPDAYGGGTGGFKFNAIFNSGFEAFPEYWIEKNGKVTYGSIEPEVKNALALLSDWYGKGLIDPQFLVRDWNSASSVVANGQSGSLFAPWWAYDSMLNANYKLDSQAEWIPYAVPADKDGKVVQVNSQAALSYVVVRKGFEHPEVLLKITALLDAAHKDPGFSEGRENDAYMEALLYYHERNVSVAPPNASTDFYNALEISYKQISDALKTKDTSQMTTQIKGFYELAQAYADKLGKGEPPLPEEYSAYNSRIVGCGMLAGTTVREVTPVFFTGMQTTESMKLRWETLSRMEEETLLKIIVGEKPLDAFDTFVKEWRAAGGDQIIKEVQELVDAR